MSAVVVLKDLAAKKMFFFSLVGGGGAVLWETKPIISAAKMALTVKNVDSSSAH